MPTDERFSWGDVPVADRDWLRRRTEDIESYCYRTACDLVRIGQALAEVKKKLPRKFQIWLVTHTPLSRPAAYRMMATAKSFGPYVSQIETFEPCALYALAQEKAPQAARDHAVREAESGVRITRAVALEILDAYAPVAVGRAEVKGYEADRREVMGEQDERDAETALMEDQDEGRNARIGRAFAALVERGPVHASKVDDGENDPVYSVTVHTPGEGPRNVFDRDLGGALLRAGGVVELKFCPGCCVPGGDVLRRGEHGPVRPALIPTADFGQNRKQADFLMGQCGGCERARKRARRASEKAKKARSQAQRAN